jgi:hypothetical protein
VKWLGIWPARQLLTWVMQPTFLEFLPVGKIWTILSRLKTASVRLFAALHNYSSQGINLTEKNSCPKKMKFFIPIIMIDTTRRNCKNLHGASPKEKSGQYTTTCRSQETVDPEAMWRRSRTSGRR